VGFRSRGIGACLGSKARYDQRVIRQFHCTEKKQLELLSVFMAGLELLAGSACNLSSLGGVNEGGSYTILSGLHSCANKTQLLLVHARLTEIRVSNTAMYTL